MTDRRAACRTRCSNVLSPSCCVGDIELESTLGTTAGPRLLTRALRKGPAEVPDKGANGPRRGSNKYRKKEGEGREKEDAAVSEGSPRKDPHRLAHRSSGSRKNPWANHLLLPLSKLLCYEKGVSHYKL